MSSEARLAPSDRSSTDKRASISLATRSLGGTLDMGLVSSPVFSSANHFRGTRPFPFYRHSRTLPFRHFVLTAPRGNTHPACPILIHPFLPHQPALMTRHRRQPPTFVLERLSLGVTTPGRCGLFDAYHYTNPRRTRA